MNESGDPKEPTEEVEDVRTEEPEAPVGTDEKNPSVVSDDTSEAQSPGEDALPGLGGYEGRDPATDMPRIPSAPETQDDPKSHDAAPDAKERPPTE